MSWSKPNITNIVNPPVKLNRGRWSIFFGVFTVVTAFFLAKIWPNDNYATQWTYWLGVGFFPTVIGGGALSVRLYLYGLAQEKYDIWQHEHKNVEQNWQNWAMRSAVVMNSFYILPNKITTHEILNNESNLEAQINKSLVFDGDFELIHNLEDIFKSMSEIISKLSSKTTINITIYSSFESYEYIDEVLDKAYRNSGISHAYKLTHFTENKSNIELISDLIDNSESVVELIIINNTQSKATAFLAGFLLLNHPESENIDMKNAEAKILRPMIDEDLSVGIKQMSEMQTAIKQVNQLWFVNLEIEQEAEITKQLVNQHVTSEKQYKLEKFAGNQADLSYWLALAIGCEMIKTTNQNNLIATKKQNQWLFSVVTAV